MFLVFGTRTRKYPRERVPTFTDADTTDRNDANEECEFRRVAGPVLRHTTGDATNGGNVVRDTGDQSGILSTGAILFDTQSIAPSGTRIGRTNHEWTTHILG